MSKLNKKRIIIINQYGVTPDVPGATKHYDMAQHFAKKKSHEVEYWLSGLIHKTGKNHESLKGFKFQSSYMDSNSLKIVKIKGFPYFNNLILRQLSILFFEFITGVKILFSKNIQYVIINTPPVGFFNILTTKLRRKKLIVDVEDLWPLFLIEMGMKNKFAERYMNVCSKYSYKAADGISTVSKGMYDYVNKISNKKEKIWVAPLGVNTKDYFNKTPDNNLINEKKWKNDFKIMYLGALAKANDIISVLDTISVFNKTYPLFKGNKRISFIFIGDGEQKKKIVDYAKSLKLENVFIEDPVPGSMVPEYLIHADICLTNLLKIDSFKLVRPNKLFQYMALEKPIISGIWGEFQEIIEAENAGIYVDFTDYQKTSKEIYNLINDDLLLNKMKQNGRKYIEEFGDRDKIFDEYFREMTELNPEGLNV